MARQPDDTKAAKFKSDDAALIRELALLLDETSLTEIEIERAGLRVRVARNISVTAAMPANYQPAPIATGAVSVTPAAGAAEAAGAGWKWLGIEAAMLMLRATRSRRPERSISISVRLVSSSSKASSRTSALSSLVNFAAFVSSGWRAMILIRSFLLG